MKEIKTADLSEYFNYISKYSNIFHDGLEIFYDVTENMKDIYVEYRADKDDYDNLEYKSIMENIGMVKEFYKEMNLDVDVDKFVADGTIDFINNKNGKILQGLCKYEKSGFVGVNVWKMSNLLDGAVMVHELAHRRDVAKTQTADMFTEAIAFAEERIYIDFLERKGYKKVKEVWNSFVNDIMSNFYKHAFYNLKIYLLFKNLGNIDKSSYKLYYGDDSDYEEVMNGFINNNSLEFYCGYSFGYALSLYIYDKFKNGELSIKDINDVHGLMNKNARAIVDKIGLYSISAESREEIYEAAKRVYQSSKKEELAIKH